MSHTTRLISFTTLFLAVVLPSIALFILGDKNLARIIFGVVIVVGYAIVFVRWRRHI